jgi:hypothetical protein
MLIAVIGGLIQILGLVHSRATALRSELDQIIAPEIKDDAFYRLIRDLAAGEALRHVLEIGSSAGGGSTEAFVAGLAQNAGQPKLFCIEVSKPRFEVQIRTMLEHAWAEIEHDLGYKSKEAMPAPVRRRLQRLAGMLELADHEFVKIRQDLERYAERLPERLAADEPIPIDRLTLEGLVSCEECERLDHRIAALLGKPLGANLFFPDYLVRMLRAAGFKSINDAAGIGRILRDCPECPEVVVVPAGATRLASGRDVTIAAPFAVGKFEVTFAEWDACVAAGGCDHRPDDVGWGRGRQPVMNVNWDDAQQYVAWLSRTTGKTYRFLSEAEWEYAAQAGSAREQVARPGANEANCDVCGSRWDRKQTAPVGSFAANAFGLHDMLGNVSEWAADCWNERHAGAPTGGSARQSGE